MTTKSISLKLIKSLAKKCSSEPDFKKQYPEAYARASEKEWLDQLAYKREKYSKADIQRIASRCRNKNELAKKYRKYYMAAYRRGQKFLDDLEFVQSDSSLTFEVLQAEARFCNSAKEFELTYPEGFEVAKRNPGWLKRLQFGPQSAQVGTGKFNCKPYGISQIANRWLLSPRAK